jgi:hypothetical protein
VIIDITVIIIIIIIIIISIIVIDMISSMVRSERISGDKTARLPNIFTVEIEVWDEK